MHQERFDFEGDRERSLDERFEAALVAQPDLYPTFCSIAKKLRAAGQRHYSSKAIVEIARYHRVLEGKDAAGYKINNIWTSRLSRKMIADFPEYADFFTLRKLTTREDD